MNKIADIWRDISEASEIGKEIARPEEWADRATRTGLISRILFLAVGVLGTFGISLDASDGSIREIAVGLSSLVGLVLSYLSNRMHQASNPNAGKKCL